jgi:hypothetical protein
MTAFAASTAQKTSKTSDGVIIPVGLDYVSPGCVVKQGDIIVIAAADIAGTTVGGLGYPGCPVTNTDWTTEVCATGDLFAGVAVESVTSTARYSPTIGFALGNHVRVATEGEFEFTCSGLAIADIGSKAWASTVDAHTVTNTEAIDGAAPVGIITWVNLNSSATKCRVLITGTAMTANGLAAHD